jgi:hypothetical protein
MQRAAGSAVVTAISQRHPVTGAISLTPQTMVEGAMVPAKTVLAVNSLFDLLGNGTAWTLVGLVFLQVVFVTMVYGPIAAYLVEAFPARIRYTAMSLPYHIGNGVFGGLLPLIGIPRRGNIYAGLYCPVVVAWSLLWWAPALGNASPQDLGGDGDRDDSVIR